MKTKQLKIASLILGLTLLSVPAWAASDFSKYTTEEMHEMRGTMQNATEKERNAFQHEWQRRMREMPVEDRSKYSGKGRKEQADWSSPGKGQGQGKGQGKKSGNAYRYGHGKSDDAGSGYGSGMGGGSGHGGGGGGRGQGGGGGRGR